MTKTYSCLLFIISIILAIAIGEIFLFFLNRTPLTYTINEFYSFDCYAKGQSYWVTLKSNTTCLFHSSQHAFSDQSIRTNAYGIRNRVVQTPKPKNTKRILVLGDSFTFGLGVAEQDTYPRILEQILTSSIPSGTAVEVINAGIPTADIGYYYLFLKTVAPRLEPDIILIGYDPYNDTHDEEIRPTWTKTDTDGLPITIDSETAYIGSDGKMYSKTVPFLMRFPFLRKSRIVLLMIHVYLSLSQQREQKTALIPKQLCIFRSSCHTFDEDKLHAKKLFAAMKNLDAVRGKPLIVGLIPMEFQIYDMGRFKFNIPIALTPEEKRFPEKELTTMLASLDIPSFDLLPVFTAHKTPATYFEKDIHWNEQGHKIAAEALAPVLLPYLTQ